MGAVLISTKGQIVLPVAVRAALGLKPGMRVNVKVDGKKALITRAPEKKTVSLQQIQSLLRIGWNNFVRVGVESQKV